MITFNLIFRVSSGHKISNENGDDGDVAVDEDEDDGPDSDCGILEGEEDFYCGEEGEDGMDEENELFLIGDDESSEPSSLAERNEQRVDSNGYVCSNSYKQVAIIY